MKTLVIHPEDKTTDVLNVIYADIECKVITQDISEEDLIKEINDHERIIMLGHGGPSGMFGFRRSAINKNLVEHLRDKVMVTVWCHANEFFERHGLTGFYTGMIISEVQYKNFSRLGVISNVFKGCLLLHIYDINSICSAR